MLYLSRKVTEIAQQELTRRDVFAHVTGVRFVSDNGCSMIRISFFQETQPKIVLSGFEYLIYEDNEYHLYLPIDIIVTKL